MNRPPEDGFPSPAGPPVSPYPPDVAPPPYHNPRGPEDFPFYLPQYWPDPVYAGTARI